MTLSLLFVVLWLASYRATRFVLDDSLLDYPREEFYRHFPPDGTNYNNLMRARDEYGRKYWRPITDTDPPRHSSMVGDLFYCYWCLGFWFAGAAVLIALYWVSIPLPVAWWAALSTLIGLTAHNLDSD